MAILIAQVVAQSTTVSPQAALEEAERDEREALKQANVTVEKLQKWLEGIQTSASKPDETDEVASKIQSEAESDFRSEYESMVSSFDKKLKELADAEDVHEAAKELKTLSKDIQKESKKMAKEMKKKYYALRTSQKDKAQDLMQEAQKEAHYAMKMARKVEHFGRKAGQKEAEYEGNIGKAEKNTEHLSGVAEKYGEKAERVVEKFFEKVEDKVEDRADAVEHQAEAKQKEREQSIKDALEEAAGKATPAGKKAPAAVFLSSSQEFSPEALLSTVLPATGLATLVLAVAWYRRRPTLSMPPSLG